jgi:hypothetical protein
LTSSGSSYLRRRVDLIGPWANSFPALTGIIVGHSFVMHTFDVRLDDGRMLHYVAAGDVRFKDSENATELMERDTSVSPGQRSRRRLAVVETDGIRK